MMGWLSGKTVRIAGSHTYVEAALKNAGATLVNEARSDIFIYIVEASPAKPAHEMSHAEWRESLDKRLDQCFLQANEFAKDCRARVVGGAVLFIGGPEQALGVDHAAAAGALGNLTKTLGVEWARDGIRVNAILTHQADETVGNLAAYLVSDYAAYVTGATMGVDEND